MIYGSSCQVNRDCTGSYTKNCSANCGESCTDPLENGASFFVRRIEMPIKIILDQIDRLLWTVAFLMRKGDPA